MEKIRPRSRVPARTRLAVCTEGEPYGVVPELEREFHVREGCVEDWFGMSG